jgi:hypothetical protein
MAGALCDQPREALIPGMDPEPLQEALLDAIAAALATFTTQDCPNFLAAGYDLS